MCLAWEESMAEVDSWRQLTSTGNRRSEVVLAVNYAVPGRPEAGIADLAANLTVDYPVWETVPPPIGQERGMSGADYISRWVDGVRSNGWIVRGILGNCAGSAYVSAMANDIEARQGRRPKVVIFDPELPTELTMYWQFRLVIAGMSGLLDQCTIDKANLAAERAMAEHTNLGLLSAELVGMFREIGGMAFDRLGLDACRQDEMVAVFASYLAYLVGANEAGSVTGWNLATAISSSTLLSGLNRVEEPERSQLVGQEIRFDVEHGDLLRSVDVARRFRNCSGDWGGRTGNAGPGQVRPAAGLPAGGYRRRYAQGGGAVAAGTVGSGERGQQCLLRRRGGRTTAGGGARRGPRPAAAPVRGAPHRIHRAGCPAAQEDSAGGPDQG
jgi:hypothetical protein